MLSYAYHCCPFLSLEDEREKAVTKIEEDVLYNVSWSSHPALWNATTTSWKADGVVLIGGDGSGVGDDGECVCVRAQRLIVSLSLSLSVSLSPCYLTFIPSILPPSFQHLYPGSLSIFSSSSSSSPPSLPSPPSSSYLRKLLIGEQSAAPKKKLNRPLFRRDRSEIE